ncbi:DUF7010 family protein [Bacillus rubiinfantis]|uniref:DUF7010 family protein n=1 Tax=Bacillus rubiinfantis TaxID=1499680 RepID=UPI0005A9895A|nr:hypothetical protein [Bacillus rubiinfantis]
MSNLDELRLDCAVKQKRGLHFILASVFVWLTISIIHLTELHILTKNLYTFFCTGFLFPLAMLISKIIKADFQNKRNPLTMLGVLFALNQLLYLIIAMWVYPTIPDKMLMVLAIIFGAHLLPFGWLYKSRFYTVLAIAVPIIALVVGITYQPYVLALSMFVIEILFSIGLMFENKKLKFETENNLYL